MARRTVIVTCALTGGVHTKEDNPYLPEQPDEIIEQAYDAYNAGAAIIHCHARRPDGGYTTDPEIFGRIHDGIKARCPDAIINLTTGGGLGLSVEERLRSTEVRPEICSLNMGLLNFYLRGKEYFFSNNRTDIERFAQRMKEYGIKPELEVYNISMLDEVQVLIKKGLVDKPYWIDFVLHTPTQGGLKGTPRNLMDLYERLPADSIFTVCSCGPTQNPITTMALLLGGHIRVGMEDNIYYRQGELVKTNAQLVERAVRIIRELELEPATPDEARAMLGMKKRAAAVAP